MPAINADYYDNFRKKLENMEFKCLGRTNVSALMCTVKDVIAVEGQYHLMTKISNSWVMQIGPRNGSLKIPITNHEFGAFLEDVDQILFKDIALIEYSGQKFYFPYDVEKFMPNLIVIEIINTSIEFLQVDALKSHRNLKTLIVTGNPRLNTLNGFFNGGSSLLYIDFSYNKIGYDAHNSLNDVSKQLKFLNVDGNECIKAANTTNVSEIVKVYRQKCVPKFYDRISVGGSTKTFDANNKEVVFQ